MEYIQNRNGQFVVGNEKIRLKGFGIGSWLNLEHYMVGLPTPDSLIRASYEAVYGKANAGKFWEEYIYSFIKEEDFELIRESGANFLRVPFNYRHFIDDNKESLKEEGFTYLTYLLDLCDKYGIYVLLDLHTAPGGQNPDWHSDNRTGIPQFWKFQVFRRQITKLWGEIAKRFADREFLFGYDLLNEPAMCQWEALNEFYRETIQEIRKSDRNHMIVLEGDHFAMDFRELEQFDDPQICLGFHFYPICWYPRLSEPDCTREEFNVLFREVLTTILTQCQKYGKPYICGEFGFERDGVSEELLNIRMKDTLRLFEEFDLSWVIWTYKDIGDMGLVYLKREMPWIRLTLEIQESWSQEKEKAEARELLSLCRKNRYSMMEADMEYLLSFRVRAMLYELQARYILQKELKKIPWEQMKNYVGNFELKNCEVDRTFLNIMKEITCS